MFHLVLGFTLLTNFLGFTNKSTILDVTDRFGSPYSVENVDNGKVQKFIYKRQDYICSVYCNKKGQVLDISAYGVNSHVKFKNVKLGDEFKDIIVNIGKPDSYSFKDKYVTLNYKNSHFTVVKLQKAYQIVEIDVDFTNASDATR